MPVSIADLLARDRRARTKALALVAGAALVAFWILDAAIDAALDGRTFRDEVLSPGVAELWVRLLVATLAALLWLGGIARRRLRLLSAALDANPDGVQITTLDGRIAWSNRSVRDLYGFTPEELEGRDVNELNVDPAFAAQLILPALAREGRWAGELEVKHKDGRTFPIWLTTSVVRDRRGAPFAAVGSIRDISARKRAEEELRRYAQRLEAATQLKELFADILRHDLLGPASTLRLSLELLLRHPLDAASQQIVRNALRSCGRLTDLVDGAARYAKLSVAEEIERGSLDLVQVLREVLAEAELAREERGATIAFDPACAAAPARANPLVAEVFENLLSNAIKYGPRGGAIRVELEDAGARWKVSISDQGEGIADADKARVFLRFERLRKEGVKGTGLGLAIARRIVELHAGDVWVEDAPGGGARFCVSLPKE